jgi:chloride channel 3/4/5
MVRMNQLPYLECKRDYLWGGRTLQDVLNTRVDVIRADHDETVEMLQDKLRRVQEEGDGFPVVVKEGGMYKAIGYIGNNELENALSK